MAEWPMARPWPGLHHVRLVGHLRQGYASTNLDMAMPGNDLQARSTRLWVRAD